MGFSRPFPPPGDLPNPGIKPVSPALQADFLPLSHLGSPMTRIAFFKCAFPAAPALSSNHPLYYYNCHWLDLTHLHVCIAQKSAHKSCCVWQDRKEVMGLHYLLGGIIERSLIRTWEWWGEDTCIWLLYCWTQFPYHMRKHTGKMLSNCQKPHDWCTCWARRREQWGVGCAFAGWLSGDWCKSRLCAIRAREGGQASMLWPDKAVRRFCENSRQDCWLLTLILYQRKQDKNALIPCRKEFASIKEEEGITGIHCINTFRSADWRKYDFPIVPSAPQECSVKNPLAIARDASLIPVSESGRSEEEMATPSSILAWKSHGQSSLVGYSPWGHTQLSEWAHTHVVSSRKIHKSL